jgi:hypothetical protein
MTTTREILIAARAKIERPECWTKGKYARDKDGESVTPNSRSAVCWCAIGAVHAAYPSDAERTLIRLSWFVPTKGGISTYNDYPETTHADILALYDRAIASLPEDAP